MSDEVLILGWIVLIFAIVGDGNAAMIAAGVAAIYFAVSFTLAGIIRACAIASNCVTSFVAFIDGDD